MMKIPFYFDYYCPWAYLANCRVEGYFADLDVEIEFRPVRLGVVAEKTATPGLPPGDRKRAWYLSDLQAWAELCGAEFAAIDMKAKRPSTRLLLQASVVAADRGVFREFHYPAYRARWADARAVDDPAVVRELLEGAGLPGEEALAAAQSQEVAERLDQDTQAAIDRGVFGVPSLFVGDRMYWGNDRLELVRHAIEAQA
jgi:2-hydroxychromene-2-carboxylate isomerase